MNFENIVFNPHSQIVHSNLKGLFERIDAQMETLVDSRSKSIAITKLEEAFMWVGKAIRDDQNKYNEE